MLQGVKSINITMNKDQSKEELRKLHILFLSKTKMSKEFAEIIIKARLDEKDLTIDELLEIKKLLQRRQREHYFESRQVLKLDQLELEEQAYQTKRKRKQRMRLMVAACMILFLLPLAWFSLQINPKNEKSAQKSTLKAPSITLEKPKISPKTPKPNQPLTSTLAVPALASSHIKAQPLASSLVRRIHPYRYREIGKKELRILDNERIFTLANQGRQDTLLFVLLVPAGERTDTLYQKSLAYSDLATIYKNELPPVNRVYYYSVLGKKHRLIHQGWFSMNPIPAQKE